MQGMCLCLVYHVCNTILTYCWLPSVFFRWFAHGLVKPIGNSTKWTQSAVKRKAFEHGAKSMVTESAIRVIEIARCLFSKQTKTTGPQWTTLPCFWFHLRPSWSILSPVQPHMYMCVPCNWQCDSWNCGIHTRKKLFFSIKKIGVFQEAKLGLTFNSWAMTKSCIPNRPYGSCHSVCGFSDLVHPHLFRSLVCSGTQNLVDVMYYASPFMQETP